MNKATLRRSAYKSLMTAWCCAILLSFDVSVQAQQQMPDNTETLQLPQASQQQNFFEMRQAFQRRWEEIKLRRREIDEAQKKETASGNQVPVGQKKGQGGYKTFKRWEWYWGTRVGEDGSFPTPEQYRQEWQKYVEQRNKSVIIRDMAGRTAKKKESPQNIWTNWGHLGPFGAPATQNNNTTGGSGLGRISSIAFGGTEDTIYAGTPASGLWRTTNRGQSWAPMSTELPPHGVLAIAVDPRLNGRVYMGTSQMSILGVSNFGSSRAGLGVYRSNDRGDTWTLMSSGLPSGANIRRLRIHPTNPDTIFAATDQGIFRSNNGGVGWFMVSGGDVADLEFHPSNPSILYATSYTDAGSTRARIWRSTTGGTLNSFTAIMTNIPLSYGRIEIAVSANQSNWIYAMCSDTSIVSFRAMYRSTDTGSTWTAIVSPGALNTLLGTQAFVNFVLGVAPGDANVVSAGGLDFWRSDNGGGTNTWQKKTDWQSGASSYLHSDQWEMAYPPGSNGSIVYMGNDGGIYRSSNWGTNWTSIVGNMSTMTLYRLGIDQNHADMTMVGSQDNGSSRYWPYVSGTWHATWEKVRGGDGMESVVSPSNNNDKVYTMIQNGKLSRSNDWGASYGDITPSGQLDGQGNGRGAWVTPMIFDNTYNCVLTGYDRIYAIKDQEPNIPEVGQRQISVPFPNAGELAIAVETNGSTMYVATISVNQDSFRLYRAAVTTESYTPPMSAAVYSFPKVTSWTLLTGGPATRPVTSIKIHPDDDNVVYVTCGRNGSVFKSVNKGRTWINITGGLPQVSVNSIVFDDDNNKPHREGLYIGTDFGVYYRDNAMADWDVFDIGNGFGMANSPVMELEIHKSQGLVRAATFGRGLYESELFTPSIYTKYYPVAYGRNSDSYWINKVKFWSANGTPEQTTGDNNGYIDLTRSTTLNVQMFTGGTHKLELSRGIAGGVSTSAPVKWRVWIDLNEDGTFDDAGELVGSADNTAATALTTIFLTIPTTYTQVGPTRMRIAMGVNGTPAHNAPFTTGEVEDYTVEIRDCLNFSGVLSAYPISANSATIVWSGSTTSTYELRYRVKNAATWSYGTSSITQPYSDYPDFFSCTLNNLTANTYYEVQVRANCGYANAGVATSWLPSSPFLIRTIPSSAPYCASYSMPMQGALSDCETYIKTVKLTKGLTTLMNHSSSNDFGYQKFGYSSFNLPMAELPAGNWFGVNLVAEELCPPDFNDLFRRWRIWVDLDQNNTFDSDELLYDSNNSTNVLTQSGSMYIPLSGTTLGLTRMRVSMKGIDYSNTAANAAGPCEVLDYGEVQDYKIQLYNPNARGIVTGYADDPAQDVLLHVSPNPATDELRVEYNCVAAADAAVEVVDMFGRVVATMQQPCMQGRNTLVMSLYHLSSGVYTLRITNMHSVVTQSFTIVK